MLRFPSSLVDLTIVCPAISESYGGWSMGPIVVPHVKSLTLDVDEECNVEDLARLVMFPELTALTLYGEHSSGESQQRYAFAATHQSPNIEKLLISYVEDPIDGFLLMLWHLNNLHTLTLENTHFTNDNLQRLRATLFPSVNPASWLCKKLGLITFGRGCTFAQDCDPEILPTFTALRASAMRIGAASEAEDRPYEFAGLLVEGWQSPMDRRGDY